ncbi:nucleotide-binding universal stress UspA family protein [Tenacibaculum adriaticum]|uniref:Nucleotide-binding universal stress UspA family protein n=1 Tax=Tenacibaculum adriaticum TaxID=413713 RepID=A0A5S5DV05_9FLAO|nr:universal stress protein [Tenacibaculum adriaticum]TYP98876.1 nucleotide-binding universal stress UspA family protein [Tenacibaculum adriaticum]
MKNILIPYDFSETAINALNYTKKLFENHRANIYVLGVYISTPSEILNTEYNDRWFNEIDDSIEDELNYLIEVLNNNKESNLNFSAIVKSESIINAIKSAIKEKQIDLVVTGTKGAHSLVETFIGTNTINMINHINECSILVVPTNYKYKSLHQIVFSTNYKRPFNLKELKTLIELSIIKGCSIEVVNLSVEDFFTDNQRKNKVKLRELFQDLNVDYKKIDWQDSETKTLENHIEEIESELLVLINHKHNFFNRLIEENVIKKSAFHSKIPLLILPEQE